MASNQKPRTSVLVVDDSEVVRTNMRGLLRDAPGFQQIGESVDGPSGIEKAGRLRPDIVVMDLKMPGMSGIEATWKLGTAAPESRVLVLSVSSEGEDVADAVMAGAQGYVVKGAPDDEILAALARVAAGERAISPAVAHTLVDRAGGAAAPVPEPSPEPEPEPAAALGPLPTGWMVTIGLCGGVAIAAVGPGQGIFDGSASSSGVWLQMLAGFVISLGVAWLAMLATQLDD